MRLRDVVFLLLTTIAIARIAATYKVFNATADEPSHIAAGMQWLSGHPVARQGEHPPLGRVAVAIGPRARGLELPGYSQENIDGVLMLYSNGEYWGNLTSARVGTLPFFVLGCLMVYLWSARWFSSATALWATLAFTTLPPILAHAGLATIDMACTATVILALYCFLRWMESPSPARAIYFGAAVAVAMLSKLSSIPFLGVCGIAAIALQLSRRQFVKPRVAHLALMAGVAFVVLWGGYRFALTPAGPPGAMRLPFGEWIAAIRNLAHHNARPHGAYLLGKYSDTGWWYFFPVALSVKTPIAFLLLTFAGAWAIGRKATSQQLLTAIFPLAILAVGMASKINIGVRHVLPMYPFLAILAGHAIALSFARNSKMLAFASMLLVAWMIVDTTRAHPDYLAYFNEFAGDHPENILTDSDLDWGQDLHRLAIRLRELHVQRVYVGYFGAEGVWGVNMPPAARLSPVKIPYGYVAISLFTLTRGNAKDQSYAYFKYMVPIERVGKSIELYYRERPTKPIQNEISNPLY